MPDVLLDIDAGIARLTLNRPDAANGIDLATARALHEAVEQLAADDSVRVVVLSGAGARFCGGGDVRGFAAAQDVGALLNDITEALHSAIAGLCALRAPVIAAVQGSAAGAGLGLVAAADIAVASASCRFVMAYTGIGLTPDGSTTWFLPRLIGYRRAVELTLTNRVLGADEAQRIGLISEVVADEQLAGRVEELAASLANGPTAAYGAVKRLFAASMTTGLVEQMALESATIADAATTADGQEGVASFVAKRKPTFTGR